MITVKDGVFQLETQETSYIFRVSTYGQLEHIYYGERLSEPNVLSLALRTTAQTGATVAYNRHDVLYSLDTLCQEWSGIGKGDYRYSPAELIMPDGGFVCDFVYESHSVKEGTLPMTQGLPQSEPGRAACEHLSVRLRDTSCQVSLILVYTVFETENMITRRTILENHEETPLVIRRLLSAIMDMPNMGFHMSTFDGDWIKEARRHDRKLQYGMFVNDSRTGASGNKHNPGFLLYEDGASENHGRVYGFNLVYSGNHFGFAELCSHDLVRVGIGINPHCFSWTLGKGDRFETPEALLTFSGEGLNGVSDNFHRFIHRHIIPKAWRGKERPVLYNAWEPCFFQYDRRKLLRLARLAKDLGMELFVVDDGWFAGRDHDRAGLGDYTPNRRKFPQGLAPFARKLRSMGLAFGIWAEPEMVNEDSDLFRAHPEYAVKMPRREPTLGRNQLVLDLCNPAVRDYIVKSMGELLDDTEAAYVKWDMNRHISEFWSDHIPGPGEFFHRYILGLYDILRRIFSPRPNVLLESCSSGGNRFDLGMLCFSPQIWTSDNTDPAVRLKIQGGLSYLYPLSAMGAHVSDAPHQQTLRDTPLSTRFNLSCFGCLGYELDLRHLTPMEKKEIKEQIVFYKRYRHTLQFGRFQRIPQVKSNKTLWLCQNEDSGEAVAGFFQGTSDVSEGPDILRLPGFQRENTYTLSAKPQRLYVKRFGGLVKHILPVALNPGGLILQIANRHYALDDCVETHRVQGGTLAAGIPLSSPFLGTNYTDKTRLLGDFGSTLYTVEKV